MGRTKSFSFSNIEDKHSQHVPGDNWDLCKNELRNVISMRYDFHPPLKYFFGAMLYNVHLKNLKRDFFKMDFM